MFGVIFYVTLSYMDKMWKKAGASSKPLMLYKFTESCSRSNMFTFPKAFHHNRTFLTCTKWFCRQWIVKSVQNLKKTVLRKHNSLIQPPVFTVFKMDPHHVLRTISVCLVWFIPALFLFSKSFQRPCSTILKSFQISNKNVVSVTDQLCFAATRCLSLPEATLNRTDHFYPIILN